MIINGSPCGKVKPLGKLDFLHFLSVPNCRASYTIVYAPFATHRAEKIQRIFQGWDNICCWRPAEQDMKHRLGPGRTGGARTGTPWVLGLIVLVARAVAPSGWTCPSLLRTSCAVSRLPSSTSSSPSQLSPNTQMELTKQLE